MSLKFDNVIVFGPTGAVGAFAALEASNRGAKVWLAMRDTSKSIGHFPAEIEAAGNFARVRGDLTDPTSVTKAIQTSGAKAAFIYVIMGSKDFGVASVHALRAAGVEHVVFLSSYSVHEEGAELHTIPKEHSTPYAHAQIEIALEDAAFPTSVALRAGWFASNFLRNFLDRSVTPPKGTMLYEDTVSDSITPEDIGAVSGALLVNPPAGASGRQSIYLFGPKQRTFKESWELVKQITGRTDIDTSVTAPETFIASMVKKGFPEGIAKHVVEALKEGRGGLPELLYRDGAQNVKKYTGREPMGFIEFLEKHKGDI